MSIRVSNTNANSRQKSVVRMYNEENVKIAEVFINKYNPLSYIQSVASSKYLTELFSQLKDAINSGKVTEADCRNMADEFGLNISF